MSDKVAVGTKIRNKLDWKNDNLPIGLEGVISNNTGRLWTYEVDFPGEDQYGIPLTGIPMDREEFDIVEEN